MRLKIAEKLFTIRGIIEFRGLGIIGFRERGSIAKKL